MTALEIAGIVTGSVGFLTAVGAGIKWIADRRINKHMMEVQARDFELESLRKQYNWLKQQFDEINMKVDELYGQLHKLENERLDLLKRNGELELALKVAQYNICERPDDECIRRLPARQKCRLKMLLNGTYESEEAVEAQKDEPEEQRGRHDNGDKPERD